MSERHIPSGELVRLEADLLAIAHATGIVYEPDTGPCWPGPKQAIAAARAAIKKAEGK